MEVVLGPVLTLHLPHTIQHRSTGYESDQPRKFHKIIQQILLDNPLGTSTIDAGYESDEPWKLSSIIHENFNRLSMKV